MGIFRKTDRRNIKKRAEVKLADIPGKDNDIQAGTVGQDKENLFQNNLLSFQKSNLFEVDQFKKLRSRLLFPTRGKIPRSVAVTSPDVGEGGSFICKSGCKYSSKY